MALECHTELYMDSSVWNDLNETCLSNDIEVMELGELDAVFAVSIPHCKLTVMTLSMHAHMLVYNMIC